MYLMATIDVTQALIGYNGKEIVFKEADAEQPVIFWDFRTAAIMALRIPKEGQTASEKYDIERLMALLHRKDSITLKSEDVVLIKTVVGEHFSAELVGPMFRILEPDTYNDEE